MRTRKTERNSHLKNTKLHVDVSFLHCAVVVRKLALEARKAVERLLKAGAKTGEDLRREYLGNPPDGVEERKTYDAKYQALRRALESMIEERVIEAPKYRLAGEVADQNYVLKSIRHFKETIDPTKHKFLMDDIESECRKRDAILTPGILIFLKKRLDDESPEIMKLAISCLSYMASRVNETRKTDLSLLRRLRRDYSLRLLEVVEKDQSLDVRIEAFKLLLLLGDPKTVFVIDNILRHSSADIFRQFKYALKSELCQPYDDQAFFKNRFLRDHKDKLRNMLTEIRLKSLDPHAEERAEFILWHLRHGPTNMMPGGVEERLQ